MAEFKRFIDCYIPTETCNLRCHYCYVTHKRSFNSKLMKLGKTDAEIRAAFAPERWGGTCMINLCAGGETLLSPEVVPFTRSLLELGHYVMVVTNATIRKRFEEFAAFPAELKKRLFLKCSFQYLELRRLGWVERFCDNVRLARDSGCSVTVEVTPSDELIPYIDELKQVCVERFGALCHVTVARDVRTQGINLLTRLTREQYEQTWAPFDSELFRFKMRLYKVKRKEFCYAGLWSFYTNLITGEIRQCYCGEVIGDLYDTARPIGFKPVGKHCTLPYCYNGHAFLGFGAIPALDAPSFAELRDRQTAGGERWLLPEMSEYMSKKLAGDNELVDERIYRFTVADRISNLRERCKAGLRVTYYKMRKIMQRAGGKSSGIRGS